MKKTAIVIAILGIAAAGAAYLWLGSSAPRGQVPLTTLSLSNFATFEKAFDQSPDGPRLLLLVSPT